MSEGRYMDGRGINQRTRELTDALWDAFLPAWLGTSIGIVAIMVGMIFAFWQDGPILIVGVGLMALGMSAAIGGAGPWFEARARLNEHTAAIRRETERYGRGWARD